MANDNNRKVAWYEATGGLGGGYTAVSTKVVQLKSIKAYATIPKGMMGCGCSLLHRQVHEFSARWKAPL